MISLRALFLLYVFREIDARSNMFHKLKFDKCSLIGCTTILFAAISVQAAEPRGQSLFELNCIGCHSGGGNIFDPTRSLKKDMLIKNNVFDELAIRRITKEGAGRMPAYGAFVSPVGNLMAAKLTDVEIGDVSSFVKDQAEKDWPNLAPTKSKNCDVYPGC